MSRRNYLFTSESVSEGHPDKLCDRISDAIVDDCQHHSARCREARVACETLATTNRVVIAGEVRGSPKSGMAAVMDGEAARASAIRAIGYEQDGFHWQQRQGRGAPARAVRRHRAGRRQPRQQGRRRRRPGHHVRLRLPRDAGSCMPAPILYAHKILRLMAEARRSGREPASARTRRSQVTVAYEDGVPTGERLHRRLHAALCDATLRIGGHQAGIVEPYVRRGAARRLGQRQDRLARQPDRKIRHRRPGRRLRPDRPQDHRRHLWRRGAAWRRRLLRQGSDQGRPLGRLCRALSRQERRRRRLRRPLHHPALLRDRRRRSRCPSMSTCTIPAASSRRRWRPRSARRWTFRRAASASIST